MYGHIYSLGPLQSIEVPDEKASEQKPKGEKFVNLNDWKLHQPLRI